ncbi:MAG TPA: hypothetical protein VM099_07840 [Gemmatimonadaceae bacterium]|nr:hypothetical protein [Gemmatimonadaceae bacterium]
MQFTGAVVRDRRFNFAVAIVRPTVLRSTVEATKVQLAFAPVFRGMPLVLMAQDEVGTPTFHGRADLVEILKHTNLDQVHWKVYSSS